MARQRPCARRRDSRLHQGDADAAAALATVHRQGPQQQDIVAADLDRPEPHRAAQHAILRPRQNTDPRPAPRLRANDRRIWRSGPGPKPASVSASMRGSSSARSRRMSQSLVWADADMAFDYARKSAKASLTSADWALHRLQARPAAAPYRGRYPAAARPGGPR